MHSEQFDLFLILLKLKSYLVSLVEPGINSGNSFDYTEEYLERKYPEHKEEIMELLTKNDIQGDKEIVFDEKMHLKFKEMLKTKGIVSDLPSILEKYNIETIEETLRDKTLSEIKSAREQKLKEIVTLLLQLARNWAQRGELENNVEDFSLLEEEDLIRPDEQKELGKLDNDTTASFKVITKLSHLYFEQLIEYYFAFGGDVMLNDFVNGLDSFKLYVDNKYKDLFKNSGLNQK